jgi:hypothetical protein
MTARVISQAPVVSLTAGVFTTDNGQRTTNKVQSRRHYLTPHAAHVLANKLRARGVHYSGRDILYWKPHTVILTRHWLETVQGRPGSLSYREFLGEYCPPPSQHSWPQISASGEPGRTAHGPELTSDFDELSRVASSVEPSRAGS